MKRMRKVLVATVAAVVAMGSANAVLAQAINDAYMNCVDRKVELGHSVKWAEQACCDEYAGSWVEIYDHNGNLIDEYCDYNLEAPAPTAPDTIGSGTTAGVDAPPVRTHVDDAIDATIGNYEQTAPPAPTTSTTVGETSGTQTTAAASGGPQRESRVTR